MSHFFPAYPAIAALFRYGLNIDSSNATPDHRAQLAAWGFWSYFFLFCKRWNVSACAPDLRCITDRRPSSSLLPGRRLFGITISDGAAGLHLLEQLRKGSAAKFWAAAHGIVMSATRIVGICMRRFFRWCARHLKQDGAVCLSHVSGFGRTRAAIGMTSASQHCGAVRILRLLLNCAGVNGTSICSRTAAGGLFPITWRCLSPASYRWLVPALNNPTEASQMSMTLGASAPCQRSRFANCFQRFAGGRAGATRAGVYFCAAAIYYISVSGVACVDMESMLRYEFCRPRSDRAGVFEFSASISHAAGVCAGIRHGGSRVAQRCRVKRPGLVRLEFYAGKLGCLIIDENKRRHYRCGTGRFDGRLIFCRRTKSMSPFWKPIRFTSAAFRALPPTKVFISISAGTASFRNRKRSKICGPRFCRTTCSCGRVPRAFLRRQIFSPIR